MARQTQTKTATKPQEQTIGGEAPTGNLPAVVQEANAFRRELELRRKAFEPKLPPHIPWEKFQANIWTAIQGNPKLMECSKATLWNACAEVAELGLSLNKSLREADILPVYDRKAVGDNGKEGCLTAQLRIRYGGYQKLARQSGVIVDIRAVEVYKWDQFRHEEGLHPILEHTPGPKPSGYEKTLHWGITNAYCVWEEVGGRKRFEVMDLEDLLRIMRRSPSYDRDKSAAQSTDVIFGPWLTDFTEQCKKTVMRRSSKWMPQSAEKNNLTSAYAKAVRLEDIREGGGRAELRDGDVLDVTEFSQSTNQPPQDKPLAQTETGKSQMDNLETKMAGIKPEPLRQQPAQQKQPDTPKQSAPVSRLELPRTNGAADWPTWLKLSEAAVTPLNTEQRVEWRATHQDLLIACEFNVPDQMETLMKMLP